MKICATVLMGPGTEEKLPDAIRSVNEAVDGFVLIEAGASGEAMRAAYAAVTKPATSNDFEWTGSYSDARQFALQCAESEGYDFAVTLDADERVNLPENIRGILEAHPDLNVFALRDRDQGYAKERILRCNAGLKWHGRVCENIEDAKQAIVAGDFWELPKTKDGDRARWERGVIECQRMIDEGDDRFKWWRHLGTCYSGLGRHAAALDCYEQAVERAKSPEDKAWATYLVCEQLILREEFQRAHDMAAMALSQHAGFLPEFGWIMAYVQFKAGNEQNASRWAQLVTTCPVDKTRVGNRGQQCRKGAQQMLAMMHSKERPPGIEHNGVRIPITPRFSDFMVKLLLAGSYEWAEAKALEAILRPDDRVLDLGAGCGYLSTLAAKKLAPGAVMAVEPDPDLVEACGLTFEENDVVVTLIEGAVWDKDEMVVLERAKDFWSNRLVGPRTESCIEVQGVQFGHLVNSHKPTVIVCDIEGTEQLLIDYRLLDYTRALIIEVHSDSIEADIESWMTEQGFARTATNERTHTYERAASG